MQTPQTDDSNKTVVIPLFEIVIYPDSRTKFNVDKATGELLLETLKNGGAARAIGLTVKSGTRPIRNNDRIAVPDGKPVPDPPGRTLG